MADMWTIGARRVSRRGLLEAAGAGGVALLIPSVAKARSLSAARWVRASSENIVVRWNEARVQVSRESRLRPPMVARALAIAHTCMFDAWAAYDGAAAGTQLGDRLRRPAHERRFANKIDALSYAGYRAGAAPFPGGRTSVFAPLMASLGLDPADSSQNAATPVGIGNLAAQAVLTFRHRDGANQLGDEPGGRPGGPHPHSTGDT